MIFGWDVSTSVIGLAVFDNNMKFVKCSYCDMRKLGTIDLFEKAIVAEKFVDELFAEYGSKNVHSFIEDRLQGFSGGKTQQQTIMKLGAFNALVTWMVIKHSGLGSVEHIHPSTAKSIMRNYGLVIQKGEDKKQLTLDFVSKREPTFPLELNRNERPQPYCYDMADAYIVGMAGNTRNPWTAKER